MPPKNDSKETIHVYLYIDGEAKEISPIPVWCGTSNAETFLPKLEPIETTCKFLWKWFLNNKKARLRKRQIMNCLPKKYAKHYPKWLKAKAESGENQMPFSWIAYWYRRLEHEKMVR